MRERTLPSGWADWGWSARLAAFALVCFLAYHGARAWFGRDLAEWTLLSPWTVGEGRWWTLLTTALAPSRSGDAAWTMLSFWFFGRVVERDAGAGRFLPLALLATIVPHLVFLAVCGVSGTDGVARGLGGATAAFVVYTAIREPFETFSVLALPIRVRLLAFVYLGVAAAATVGWVDRDDARSSVELAGAAVGALAAKFGVIPDLGALRVPGPGPGRRAAQTLGEDEVRARVDALLEKVAARGIGSLTPSERSFLQEASKRYR